MFDLESKLQILGITNIDKYEISYKYIRIFTSLWKPVPQDKIKDEEFPGLVTSHKMDDG